MYRFGGVYAARQFILPINEHFVFLICQNSSIVPQLVELLSRSFSNAESAASILSKCCQVSINMFFIKINSLIS